MEDVSATRAYETPNTQTALLKYVKLWTTIWPQTSRTILLQVSEPPRRETAPREICETAGGTPEPHHREVPVSLCNRHATESKAVILQLPNPSLSHLQEIEDRLRSSPKQKCLRDTPSTSHSTPQQADQCLTWLTLRSIYSMPSRPFVIHECITAEGPI